MESMKANSLGSGTMSIGTNALEKIEEMNRTAQMLMKTPHYAKMGADGVYAIVANAMSLGINPLEALNGGLYYVQGKVGMSSELMNSLIRQRGHSITKDPKSDDKVCILHGKRSDNGDTWICTFSMEDARRAGLMKNMYEKYPSVMIYNRCLSMLARQLFPDVIKGAGYCESELKEIADSKELPQEVLELINAEQVQELMDILYDCPEEFQSQVTEFIKTKPMCAETLEQLPVKFYEGIYKRCVKKRDETQKTIGDLQ